MNLEDFLKSSAYGQETDEPGMFREMEATELYCPRCREAVPVRKRLLLILPEGEQHEYRCAYCAESVGTKMVRHNESAGLVF